MRLSFDDVDSFKETVESLRFNNPPIDPHARQQMGSISDMLLEGSERNEDNTIPSAPITTLRRVGSSSSLNKVQDTRKSGDIYM